MPTVTVTNTKPNITHLPYTLEKRQGVQTFYPGNNQVDIKIMEAVVAQAGQEAWENFYGKFLKPLGRPVEKGESINLNELNANEFVDLIEGQMDLAELEQYRRIEEAGAKRKTVLRAIDEQAARIKEIEDKKQTKQ